MKLIEHFEYVLGLIERRAPYAEIKGGLLGMQEELHGAEQAMADIIKLGEEKAKVDAENTALKAEIARRDSDDAKGFSGWP